MGSVQIQIPNYEPPVKINSKDSPKILVMEVDESIIFNNENFDLTFDKNSGEISEWICKGESLLSEAITPNFWRAPTDNDFGNGMDSNDPYNRRYYS